MAANADETHKTPVLVFVTLGYMSRGVSVSERLELAASKDGHNSSSVVLLEECGLACWQLQIQQHDWRCTTCGAERDLGVIEAQLVALLQRVSVLVG